MTKDVMKRSRRVSLTVEEIDLLAKVLRVTMKTMPVTVDIAKRLEKIVTEEKDPEHRRITAAYRAAVPVRDGELEIDNDAEVSPSDDDGAYVMTWTWVSDEEASLCRTCKAHYDGCGDGWDGECPDCADKTEAAREVICASCGDKTTIGESPDEEHCVICANQIVDDKHAAQMADLTPHEPRAAGNE